MIRSHVASCTFNLRFYLLINVRCFSFSKTFFNFLFKFSL